MEVVSGIESLVERAVFADSVLGIEKIMPDRVQTIRFTYRVQRNPLSEVVVIITLVTSMRRLAISDFGRLRIILNDLYYRIISKGNDARVAHNEDSSIIYDTPRFRR